MAIKLSTTMRTALMNAIEAVAITGGVPKILIYSGAAPAAITTTASGTLIATLTLPSTDWLNAASNGSVTKNGSWTGAVTTVATPGYFRVTLNDGTTGLIQGDIPGDMTLATPTAIGQTITIDTFTLTAGNA